MIKRFSLLLFFLIFSTFSACDNSAIDPGFTREKADRAEPEHVSRVEKRVVALSYEAMGTIRPLTEAVIESQTSAKILNVFCIPGAAVKKDQILIQLDARQLDTRVKQAQEGLSIAKKQWIQAEKSMDAARADLDQAQSAYRRTQKLFDADIVASQKLEQDKSGFLQAKARLENAQEAVNASKALVRQAEEVVKEAEITEGYSKITSPANGIIARRMADPGDLAVPGKPLLIIQTSGALRIEANVREGLIRHVVLKQEYPVKIETINKTILSRVEEILPYADPDTRTFLIKASLPDTPGLYPGMFGRLLISIGKEDVLVIEKAAVNRIGQLEQVFVKTKESWQSVYIKTGRSFGEKIQVLSGLTGNETIGY